MTNDDKTLKKLGLDESHMLSEPLLVEDEDGNLVENPDFAQCLEEAILSTPPTYERLSNDSEWNTKRCTTARYITASFAYAAVQISPYPYPDDLDKVLQKVDEIFHNQDNIHPDFPYLSLCDINKILHEEILTMPEVKQWNEPKSGRPTGGWHEPTGNPDDEFMDLEALAHNVCLEIRKDRREFDAFNEEFESKRMEENPELN